MDVNQPDIEKIFYIEEFTTSENCFDATFIYSTNLLPSFILYSSIVRKFTITTSDPANAGTYTITVIGTLT